ncbi:Nucleoside diphosphate-linked moiety X motif 8, mitochondrial [Apostichopus japonicus]|uniref:Nucleoside diphosphate-linked moiety X motif 8, mitochondrial n=1 Tax=Stichopus japonicus TaxID=307972 RepID=A0A2G8LLB0_STIJA|nr:Nucleoside diphosphate-linked moiety X motif 8, mitochondrial [Apostichopus japonicus]
MTTVKFAASLNSNRHLLCLHLSPWSSVISTTGRRSFIHAISRKDAVCGLRGITEDNPPSPHHPSQLLLPSRDLHISPPVSSSNISINDRKSFSNLESLPLKISTDIFTESREEIIARLTEADFRKSAPRIIRKADKDKSASKSAVFMPFCLVNEEPSILFTLRSSKLTSHRGQVSFPGGRMDPSDVDVTHTALRETEEELGIPASCADVWGEITPVMDNSQHLVYGILGFIGHFESLEIRKNPDEVESVFTMTLHQLCNLENRGYTYFDRSFDTFTSPVFLGGDYRVWGLSAMMLDKAMQLILPNDYQPYGEIVFPYTSTKKKIEYSPH